MIVIDASVLAVALADDDTPGDRVRSRLHGQRLAAPELIDLEVASALRGQALGTALDERRAERALADLSQTVMLRAPHRALLPRCWELRHNVTVYDAAYIALAEALRTKLLTFDRRLARANGPRCPVELLSVPPLTR